MLNYLAAYLATALVMLASVKIAWDTRLTAAAVRWALWRTT